MIALAPQAAILHALDAGDAMSWQATLFKKTHNTICLLSFNVSQPSLLPLRLLAFAVALFYLRLFRLLIARRSILVMKRSALEGAHNGGHHVVQRDLVTLYRGSGVCAGGHWQINQLDILVVVHLAPVRWQPLTLTACNE